MRTARDYRDILQREFESRCARNGRYSLRAYARDLGLSPSSLSLIIAGKQGLSALRASKLAKSLGMSAEETGFFKDLVASQHGRGERERRLARIRLRKYDTSDTTLRLDTFQIMSDWHHFAILELTQLEGFQSSPAWISKTLGVPIKAVSSAIARLKKLGLLEESEQGRLRQTEGFLATPSGTPSQALKKFHTQILRKAEEALFLQPVEERDFSAVVFALRSGDLEWAKGELKAFRRQLMERLEQSPRKDKVYCLSIQLFGLQKQTSEPAAAPSPASPAEKGETP